MRNDVKMNLIEACRSNPSAVSGTFLSYTPGIPSPDAGASRSLCRTLLGEAIRIAEYETN